MTFSAWLINELLADGVIDEDEYDQLDMNSETLLQTTELEEADIDNYFAEYAAYCNTHGDTVIDDVRD